MDDLLPLLTDLSVTVAEDTPVGAVDDCRDNVAEHGRSDVSLHATKAHHFRPVDLTVKIKTHLRVLAREQAVEREHFGSGDAYPPVFRAVVLRRRLAGLLERQLSPLLIDGQNGRGPVVAAHTQHHPDLRANKKRELVTFSRALRSPR